MEGCVEHCDLRHVRMEGRTRPDAADLSRLVALLQEGESVEIVEGVGVHQRRR